MSSKRLVQTLQYLLLTVVLILALAPIMLMWMSAFKTRQEISVAPLALPTSLTLENLQQAWMVGRFGQYVGNSILARVDGCNEFQVFWRVLLPLAKPAVSSLVVFQFMWTWNAYLMPLLLLNQESLRPITLGLMFFQGRYTTNYALISAGVMIVTLPIVFIYVLMQRQFLRGLTAGALRG